MQPRITALDAPAGVVQLQATSRHMLFWLVAHVSITEQSKVAESALGRLGVGWVLGVVAMRL